VAFKQTACLWWKKGCVHPRCTLRRHDSEPIAAEARCLHIAVLSSVRKFQAMEWQPDQPLIRPAVLQPKERAIRKRQQDLQLALCSQICVYRQDVQSEVGNKSQRLKSRADRHTQVYWDSQFGKFGTSIGRNLGNSTTTHSKSNYTALNSTQKIRSVAVRGVSEVLLTVDSLLCTRVLDFRALTQEDF
jgi:hypothetical protein